MSLDSLNVFNLGDAASRALNGVSSLQSVTIGGTTYVVTAGFADDAIGVFALTPSGTLTDVTTVFDTAVTGLAGVFAVTTATIGDAVYVLAAGSGDDTVSAFAMGADGLLTPTGEVVDDETLGLGGVANLTTARIGETTYVFAAGASEGAITVLTLEADGSLTPGPVLADNDSLALTEPFALETISIGAKTFLYVSSQSDGTLSVFEIGVGGALSLVDTVADTDILALGLSYDLDAVRLNGTDYLIATSFTDNGVTVFSVAADGRLTPVETETDTDGQTLLGAGQAVPVTLGGTPFLLVASLAEDAVGAYEVDPNDGALGYIGSLIDDDTLNLDGAFPVTTATVEGITYLIVGGFEEDGLSVFEIFETTPEITSGLTFSGFENGAAGTLFGDIDAVIGSGDADAGVSYALLSGAVDVDGDGVAPFSLDPDTGLLTVLDTDDLDFETQPQFDLRFEAFNTQTGDVRTDTVTVTLLDTDDAPIARDDEIVTEEDTLIAGNLFADNGNGPDRDDGPFLLTQIGDVPVVAITTLDLPSGARLTVAPNGAFTYDPNGAFADLEDGQQATETVTYTVDDGEVGTDTAVLTVSVTGEDAVLRVETLTDPLDEGDLIGAMHNFIVRRTGQTDSEVTLRYAVVPGAISTVDGSDFASGVLPSGIVTLQAGVTEAVIEIPVAGDVLFETDEALTLNLGQVGADRGRAIVADGIAQAIILNDDTNVTTRGTNGRDKIKGDDSIQVIDVLAGRDRLKLGGGDDIAFGGDGDDRLRGEGGNDTLLGEDGDDRIDGGDGNDSLRGGLGADRIDGGRGADIIDGGAGDDRISGGDGEDVLGGGAGDDTLRGGRNRDTFVFSDGDERVLVRDFDIEEDILNLAGINRDIVSFDGLLTYARQDRKDLVFDFGDGDVLTLRKTDLADLDESIVLL